MQKFFKIFFVPFKGVKNIVFEEKAAKLNMYRYDSIYYARSFETRIWTFDI